MRIEAAPVTPPPMSGVQAPPEPSLSFEALLANGTQTEVEAEHRALGFQERGVLGARQAIGAPASITSDAATEREASLEALTGVACGAHADAVPAPRIGSTLEAPSPDPSGLARAVQEETVTMVRAGSDQTGGPVNSRLANRTSSRDGGAQDAVARRADLTTFEQRLRSTNPPRTPGGLVISGEDGLVQVIAGLPGLTPEGQARLRRAAVRAVAEFGLTLTELTLNGVPGPRVPPPGSET